jgi:hypothetical protein
VSKVSWSSTTQILTAAFAGFGLGYILEGSAEPDIASGV